MLAQAEQPKATEASPTKQDSKRPGLFQSKRPNQANVTNQQAKQAIMTTNKIVYLATFLWALAGLFSGTAFAVDDETVAIAGFTLIDSSSGTALGPLLDGSIINLVTQGRNLSAVAETTGSTGAFSMVRFSLDYDGDGDDDDNSCPLQQIESGLPPYSLGGSSSSAESLVVFNSVPTLAVLGEHTLTAAALDGQHNVLAVATVSFRVVEALGGDGAVTGLTLWDTATEQPIMPLGNGTVVDLAVAGHFLTIRAETTGAVNLVKFNFKDFSHHYLDRREPYTVGYEMEDDDGTTLAMIAFAPLTKTGTHSVTATAFDESGHDLGSFQVAFEVFNSDPSPAAALTSLFIDARMENNLLAPQVTLEGVTELYEPGIWIFDTAPFSRSAFEIHRYGPEFAYHAHGFAQDSLYKITLGFAEKYEPLCTNGGRVFNVLVNGLAFLTELDVFTRAGACYTALTETHTLAADGNGTFVVDFLPVTQNPMVSWIFIEAFGDSVPSVGPKELTAKPSTVPTFLVSTTKPSDTPSLAPYVSPIDPSSGAPSTAPTERLETEMPSTEQESDMPSSSPHRGVFPSFYPSSAPTEEPEEETFPPSIGLTLLPSTTLSAVPSSAPTEEPEEETFPPSLGPTLLPSTTPSAIPKESSDEPSLSPSHKPSTDSPVTPPTTFTPYPGTSYNHNSTGALTGELRKWHKVTLGFTGPETHEMDTPNPFTDYRLDVTFTHDTTQKSYVVPGFYACDGNAANTGATSGPVWLVHFAPDLTGTWDWLTSFKMGSRIAQKKGGGPSAGYFDGETGSFTVAETNKSGRDHRGKGRLQHVGKHYLQFAETGEWFLKAGADSPENFLAYQDFDNTPNYKGLRKSWEPHVLDFEVGMDPTWAGNKGMGIIGAINYLSEEGMNAFSFIPMNIGGDDQNVFPYVSPDYFERMDVSKLAQWEILFEHADHKGLNLHFKMQEHENDQLLGSLSNERVLYYRELIARFGHHLAITWNLGEENTNTDTEREAFGAYIRETDPYSHLIVVHTFVREKTLVYDPLLGLDSFDGASLQCKPWKVHQEVKEWVEKSATAGRPWICSNDEQGPPTDGVLPDSSDPNHDSIRRDVLWGTLMAGGAGVEYYFGYKYENSDLTCEDFRSRAAMWKQSRYALDFFTTNNIPFETMSNDDAAVCVLIDGQCDPNDENWCLTDGKTFVLYLKNGGLARVDLSRGAHGGIYRIKWYDPENGGSLQDGSAFTLIGGGMLGFQSIGPPPTTGYSTKDWVVLIRCENCF